MFDYNEMSKIASQLIAEFGQVVTIQSSFGTTVFDEEKSEYITPRNSHNARAAAFNYTKREIDNHHILATDLKVYLERVEAFEPKVGDAIMINGTELRIKNVSPLSPANFAVIYVLQVGK